MVVLHKLKASVNYSPFYIQLNRLYRCWLLFQVKVFLFFSSLIAALQIEMPTTCGEDLMVFVSWWNMELTLKGELLSHKNYAHRVSFVFFRFKWNSQMTQIFQMCWESAIGWSVFLSNPSECIDYRSLTWNRIFLSLRYESFFNYLR